MITLPVIRSVWFEILGHRFKVAVFFLTALIAFLVFLRYYLYEIRRKKLSLKEGAISFLLGYVGMYFGSKFFYYFMPWWSWDRDWTIMQRFVRVIDISRPGMVFYGGFFGAILTLWIYMHFRKKNFWRYLDATAPAFALSLAIARIGCLLSDDTCRGVLSNLPWAVLRVKEGEILHGGAIHPAPFYSTLYLLLLFMVLWKLKEAKKFDGWLALIGIMYYSVARFLVEFVRYYPIKLFGVISPSHVVSIIVFSTCLWIFIKKCKTSKKSSRATS